MAEELEWYALEVVRQKEYVAGFLLKRRFGCETFIPTETRWRRRNRYARGKSEIAYAAIPGVIFAGFPGPPAWFHLMALPHITGVLSIGDRPAKVDGKELAAYRETQLDGHLVVERVQVSYRGGEVDRSRRSIFVEGRGILRAPREQRHMRSHKEFASGEEVRVADGPFRDNNVRVRQIAGARAKVLLPLFGGVEATIALDELEAIA
jgi:transcription antitermination factor NusG